MLVSLGFQEESERGAYIFFAIGEAAPLLRYAWHEADEPVTAVDLTKAKTMLHWKGLLVADEFDNWAAECRLASAAS
jgi:hypothetical protein